MTRRESEPPHDTAENSSDQDNSARLWTRYQERRQRSSRALTTGLGLFGLFVLFLLAVGLWIVVVR